MPLSDKNTEAQKCGMGRGTWVAQSVKCLTLDFSSTHGLTVRGLEPCIRLCADGMEGAWDSLCASLSLPFFCSPSLSLKIN